MYEVFPEWKDKKTSNENAAYFHRFLEKKNYDNHHHFRGRTTDMEFARRMEVFLDRIDKQGLDWKKCMRKLKRRCCDLLRYERLNGLKGSKQELVGCSDFISIIGSIAKKNLMQYQEDTADAPPSATKMPKEVVSSM